MGRNRCACVALSKWCDDNYSDTNKYIHEQLQHAIEIAKTPGIYDVKQDPDEELKRMSLLASGIPGFSRLKEHPMADLKDIVQIRSFFNELVPFRIEPCVIGLSCCGRCTRHCKTRCVPDALYRIGMEASPIYLGILPYEKANTIQRACYKVMMNPNTNYRTLINTVFELLEYIRADEGRSIKDECYDYSPHIERNNTYYADCDKVTGEIHFTNWPGDGMCPYCVPPATVTNRFVERNNKHTRSAAIKARDTYVFKEDFQLDGKRRRGRPRKGGPTSR